MHVFPPEGNFDIDAGDGVGGGPFRTPQISNKSQKGHNKQVRTIIVHTSGTFFKQSTNISLKDLPIYRKNTQNPINTFKITIYIIKHDNNTKTHLNKSNMFYRKKTN